MHPGESRGFGIKIPNGITDKPGQEEIMLQSHGPCTVLGIETPFYYYKVI